MQFRDQPAASNTNDRGNCTLTPPNGRYSAYHCAHSDACLYSDTIAHHTASNNNSLDHASAHTDACSYVYANPNGNDYPYVYAGPNGNNRYTYHFRHHCHTNQPGQLSVARRPRRCRSIPL